MLAILEHPTFWFFQPLQHIYVSQFPLPLNYKHIFMYFC